MPRGPEAKGPEAEQPAQEPCPSDGGDMGGLGKLLGEFGRALDSKDFTTAETVLKRTERCLESADDRVRGHPEFEDIEASIARARPRLQRAIEKDRVTRINAAVDSLIERAEGAAARANVIVAELDSRMPTQEDVGFIQEILAEFEALAAEGEQHEVVDEPRYQQHLAKQDRFVASLQERRLQTQWQGSLSSALQMPVTSLLNAAAEAKAASTPQSRDAAIGKVREASQACLLEIGKLESEPTFDASRLVQTQLGTLAVAAVKEKCLAASDAGNGRQQGGESGETKTVAATTEPPAKTGKNARRGKRKKKRRRKKKRAR